MQNTMTGDDLKQYKLMTETPIPRLVLKMAIPTSISMVITAIYNIADTYFVSRLGTSASGAVGIVLPLMALIQAIGFTVGLGSGTWVSRLLGAKENKKADSIASSAFITALIFGAIIGVFGLIWLEPIVRIIGATDTILPYALNYAKYILCFAPAMCGSFVLNNILRAQGKAKLAMFGIASGGVLNMLLDPLFIFGFNMGISGAAIATGISQCVGFCILFYSFLSKKSIVSIAPKNASKHIIDYLLILKFGLPTLCRQTLASISTVFLNTAASDYGDAAIAAMSICGKLFMVLFALQLGIGQGYMPVLGYNYGARRYDRARKAFVFTTHVGAGLMAVFAAIMFAFAPQILTAFISDDAQVVSIGSLALRAQCMVIPFVSLMVTCNMSYETTGKSLIGTILGCARQGFFYIPLVLIMPSLYGLAGVQLCSAATDIVSVLFTIPFTIAFLRSMRKAELKKLGENGE